MIDLKDVNKIFNQDQENEFSAIKNLSLFIKEKKITVLRGPSGSGKTTLLSLIGCMARPTSGRIFLREREITSLPERFLSEIRRSTFGFVFQNFNLINGITVLENIMIPAYPTGEKAGSLKKKAISILDSLRISTKAQQRVERLSGGEQQRTAIARALINDPSVIIADEPTAHLDTELAQEFMEIMSLFQKEGKTIIISSHDPLVFEAKIVNRIISLRDGRVIQENRTGHA